MAPGELVRLRTSPFSFGTEKISPRASTTARFPFGAGEASRRAPATPTQRGVAARPSSVQWIRRRVTVPLFGSRREIAPPRSRATTPPPEDIRRTPKSLNFVTCSASFSPGVQRQTFISPSLSEAK